MDQLKAKGGFIKNKHRKIKYSVISVSLIILFLFFYQNCASTIEFASINPCPDLIDQENFVCQEVFSSYSGRIHKKKADILFVIDLSGSMKEEHQKISQSFSSFIQGLGNIDWQIGILPDNQSATTDHESGNLVNFVDSNKNDSGIKILLSNYSNYNDLFLNTLHYLQNMYRCAGCEQPFISLINAIDKKDNYNSGFFRNGVSLSAVIVTDENLGNKKDDFFSKFREAWPDKKLFIHGIIGNSTSSCADDANIIRGIIQETDGVEGDICATDYGTLLGDIGTAISREYVLLLDPIEGTVTVKVDDNGQITELNPGQFTIAGRQIFIHISTPTGSRIIVRYQYHI